MIAGLAMCKNRAKATEVRAGRSSSRGTNRWICPGVCTIINGLAVLVSCSPAIGLSAAESQRIESAVATRGLGLVLPLATLSNPSLCKGTLVSARLIEDFNVCMRWDYLAETLPRDFAPLRAAPSYDWYNTALCRVERLAPYSELERRMKGENPYLDRESLIWSQRGQIGVKNAAGT